MLISLSIILFLILSLSSLSVPFSMLLCRSPSWIHATPSSPLLFVSANFLNSLPPIENGPYRSPPTNLLHSVPPILGQWRCSGLDMWAVWLFSCMCRTLTVFFYVHNYNYHLKQLLHVTFVQLVPPEIAYWQGPKIKIIHFI